MSTHKRQTHVGVDVSKGRLDVFVRLIGERFAVPNDEAGIEGLVDRFEGVVHPTLVVLEASGGFERPVAAALAVAGLPMAVVNPRRRGTSPGLRGASPRPTPSTPKYWRVLRRLCVRVSANRR